VGQNLLIQAGDRILNFRVEPRQGRRLNRRCIKQVGRVDPAGIDPGGRRRRGTIQVVIHAERIVRIRDVRHGAVGAIDRDHPGRADRTGEGVLVLDREIIRGTTRGEVAHRNADGQRRIAGIKSGAVHDQVSIEVQVEIVIGLILDRGAAGDTSARISPLYEQQQACSHKQEEARAPDPALKIQGIRPATPAHENNFMVTPRCNIDTRLAYISTTRAHQNYC